MGYSGIQVHIECATITFANEIVFFFFIDESKAA